jgi:iron complex outermembrane receptor protein
MPPNRYELFVQYALPDGARRTETYIKVQGVHTEEQSRVPATGNIEVTQPNGSIIMASDYAPPPPAFTLLGLEAGTRVLWGQQPLYITLGVTNLLNTSYRDYMNAFRYFSDEMGRNVSVRVRVPVGKRE